MVLVVHVMDWNLDSDLVETLRFVLLWDTDAIATLVVPCSVLGHQMPVATRALAQHRSCLQLFTVC